MPTRCHQATRLCVRELTVLLWGWVSAGTDDVAPMLLVQTFPECGGDLSELLRLFERD